MANKGLMDSLLRLGLSKNETSIWLYLLEQGARTTSIIARKLKLNRGTTHLVLNQLQTKGLISQIDRKGKTEYVACEPTELSTILQKEESTLQVKKAAYELALPGLLQLKKSRSSEDPQIQHFSGVAGARKVIYECIKAREKTFRVYISLFDIIDYIGEEFFNSFIRERVDRGYIAHVISMPNKDAKARQLFKAESYGPSISKRRFVKYLGSSISYPTTMYIFDNKVGIISSKDEDHSLIITSNELSSFQRQIFDLIWHTLPETPN